MHKQQSINIWIPKLRKNAPSNASGMRGIHTPYATRKEALSHTHWANQAPYATAKRVTICDALGPDWCRDDAGRVLAQIVLDAEDYGDVLYEVHREAARLIDEGRNVDAIRLYLGL